MAHEVRNPLTGIKFLVEGALRPANPTPLADEDLRLIRQEIVRIERTVQGLLDFARMPPRTAAPTGGVTMAFTVVLQRRAQTDIANNVAWLETNRGLTAAEH